MKEDSLKHKIMDRVSKITEGFSSPFPRVGEDDL